MIVDKYMEKTSKSLLKGDLQKLAITAMLIATKYEEIYPPSIKEMIKISGDKNIGKNDILKMESGLLATLDFNFTFTTSFRVLERLAKLGNAD